MAYPANHIPQMQHYRPRNLAAVRIDGRFLYLGPYGSAAAQAEYDRLIRRWLDNGRRLPESNSTPPTVVELLVAFWDHAQVHYRKHGRPTSELGLYQIALRPVRKLYGSTPADQFGPIALEACRAELAAGGMVRASCNRMTGRIRSVFRWAAGRQLIAPEIVLALEMLPPLRAGRSAAAESEPVTAVPESDLEAVRIAVAPPIRALIDLQLWSGCRPGEAVALRGRNLDTAGLDVAGVRVWVYQVPADVNKTDHHESERTVYLGPKAQEVVRPFLKGDPAAPLFTSVSPRWRTGAAGGRAYTVSGYRQAITAACERLWPTGRHRKRPLRKGVTLAPAQAEANAAKHWHPHQLRHNAAERLEAEHGLEAAQYVLGHSRPETTRIYSEAHRRKAAEVMGRSG